jgi:hypothetical protein
MLLGEEFVRLRWTAAGDIVTFQSGRAGRQDQGSFTNGYDRSLARAASRTTGELSYGRDDSAFDIKILLPSRTTPPVEVGPPFDASFLPEDMGSLPQKTDYKHHLYN